MDYLQSLFLFCDPAENFLYFTIERGLQRFLDAECAPFNEEDVFHEVRGGMEGEGF